MKVRNILILGVLVLLVFPEIASAAGGISELEGPFEAVVGTLTGPLGRWISILAMALCGVTFILKRDDLTGGFKALLGVVFAISFISFATGIIDSMFDFSGALL